MLYDLRSVNQSCGLLSLLKLEGKGALMCSNGNFLKSPGSIWPYMAYRLSCSLSELHHLF